MHFRVRAHWLCFACLLFAGCQVLGVIGNALPDPTVGPKYVGLQHQRTAVMVWTDRSMAIDWPTLQLDLTRGIQTRLQESARKDHPKELEGTQFVPAESVVRFQRDHPESETEAIADVAPRLNINRLIYIEVEDFTTRPSDSLDLFRGTLKANLKVLGVADGRAKLLYEEPNVQVNFPEKGPEEGAPGLGDAATYEQTLTAFTTAVVNRFIPHTEPREESK